MTALRENNSPPLHPWVSAFLSKPDKELAEFLAGYAHVEPYESAERPDAARMLFGPLSPDDEARRTLDLTIQQMAE